MNRNPNTITRILHSGARLCLVVALLPFAVQVFAHGGMEHVIGTVVKVESNNLTVKTAKGNVDVKLNEKTTITRSDHPAQVADLKPGTRVVVEVMKDGNDRLAHSVQLGASSASGHPHEQHD